jgi:hypothetical protein
MITRVGHKWVVVGVTAVLLGSMVVAVFLGMHLY